MSSTPCVRKSSNHLGIDDPNDWHGRHQANGLPSSNTSGTRTNCSEAGRSAIAAKQSRGERSPNRGASPRTPHRAHLRRGHRQDRRARLEAAFFLRKPRNRNGARMNADSKQPTTPVSRKALAAGTQRVTNRRLAPCRSHAFVRTRNRSGNG